MDYPLKYVYTSHVMNFKMANKTNDADSVLIKLLYKSNAGVFAITLGFHNTIEKATCSVRRLYAPDNPYQRISF